MQGGGWCRDEVNCAQRALTPLGSSTTYPAAMTSGMEAQLGLLGTTPLNNPDFYNWNLVYARYCDGASFAGYKVEKKKNK